MTYEQVKAQLSGVNYESAIQYYTQQKKQFIIDYNKSLKEQTTMNLDKYINNFITEISNNTQGKSFALSNTLIEKLNNSLVEALQNRNMSQFNYLIEDTTKKYGELSKKGQKQLAQALNEIYDINQIHEMLIESFKQFQIDSRGISMEDIISWSKSYLRSNFYYKILDKKSSAARKSVLAGYFEEALVYKATSKLTEHLSNNIEGVLHTASEKVSAVNQKKVDSIFDLYINFSSKDLSKTFHESININTNELRSGYGAQIKLWNAPWMTKKPAISKKIANNIDLFNAWQAKKSWIEGVLFLQNKVKQALGDNVMYILGNQFYWTYELISAFKRNEYYLAFHHNGKEFTQTIAWEKIDITKPYSDD